MQNVCLVAMQSFKRGKSGRQNMETFACSHQLFVDIMFIEAYLRHQLDKNLLLNESLTTP